MNPIGHCFGQYIIPPQNFCFFFFFFHLVQVSKVNSVIRALIRFSMAVIRYADPTMGQRKGMGERYGHWWRCGPGGGDKNAEATWRAQRQNLLRMLSILLRQQPLFDPKPSPLFDERHGNIPTATRNMAVPFYVRCSSLLQ